MVIIEGEPVSSKSDSKTDPVAIADQITVDGGFGWIIAFASFLINLVVDGTAYSFGIFFEAFVQQFAASRAVTALAGSLMVGCYLSAGTPFRYLMVCNIN